MARGVNKVILIGNLGDEPTVRTTSTGKSVATISMVTNEMRRNADTGEYIETAEWHHVVLWGKLADVAKQYLNKGSQIYIEGKLRTRSYTDKQNQKRYITEVVADDMQMLGRPQGQSQGDSYSSSQNGYQQHQRQNYNSQSYGSRNGNYGNNNAGGYGQAQTQGYGSHSQEPSQMAPQAQSMEQPPAAPVEPNMDPGNDDIPF